MFFYLSKITWFLIEPGNILFIALVLGVVLLWSPWHKNGRRLLTLCAFLAIIISTIPVGKSMLMVLENRFPTNHTLPEEVDGIIALGGVVNEVVTQSRGQVTIGGGITRLTELANLSKKYPDAKLVFSGGSGKLLTQSIKEADILPPLLVTLGINPERMIYENASRNTYENANMTKSLVNPGPHENWILITSAFHMPRSIGVFRKAGWTVIPYPVDYIYSQDDPLRLFFSLPAGLNALSKSLHEWLGLVVYRLTGKTGDIFPAP